MKQMVVQREQALANLRTSEQQERIVAEAQAELTKREAEASNVFELMKSQYEQEMAQFK